MKTDNGTGYSKHARVRARRSLVQAYYQWLITRKPVTEIITEFRIDRTVLEKADVGYFERVLAGMIAAREDIDSALENILDRPLGEIDPVENAILHLGAYELMYQYDIPVRVVINEAVELAKMFGAEQSHRYINGVLDKLSHQTRKAEQSSP